MKTRNGGKYPPGLKRRLLQTLLPHNSIRRRQSVCQVLSVVTDISDGAMSGSFVNNIFIAAFANMFKYGVNKNKIILYNVQTLIIGRGP